MNVSFGGHRGPTGKAGRTPFLVAESVLVRHQLLVLNRGRKRAPQPAPGTDRIIAGLCALLPEIPASY
jgi:hypothetical protein